MGPELVSEWTQGKCFTQAQFITSALSCGLKLSLLFKIPVFSSVKWKITQAFKDIIQIKWDNIGTMLLCIYQELPLNSSGKYIVFLACKKKSKSFRKQIKNSLPLGL